MDRSGSAGKGFEERRLEDGLAYLGEIGGSLLHMAIVAREMKEDASALNKAGTRMVALSDRLDALALEVAADTLLFAGQLQGIEVTAGISRQADSISNQTIAVTDTIDDVARLLPPSAIRVRHIQGALGNASATIGRLKERLDAIVFLAAERLIRAA